MSTVTVSAGLHAPRRTASYRTAPRGPVASSAPAGRVRLTRRGRLLLSGAVLLVAVCALVLAGVMTGGVPASAGSEPGQAATAVRVTVRPGDTLWAIALREAPGVDPRATVAAILDLNALESSAVEAGSVLLLPAR
jgi:Tfp pilus assembly protein FimV